MGMKSLIGFFICCCGLYLHPLATAHVHARSFALEAGDKNISLLYAAPVIRAAPSALQFNSHLLYTRENDHQDLFAAAGLAAFTNHSGRFKLGAGIKIIAADPLAAYLSAVALGAELVYLAESASRFKLVADLYYGAQALTFSDGKNVVLQTVNADYEAAPRTFIRLGYRRIRTVLNNGVSADFTRGVYLGLLWDF